MPHVYYHPAPPENEYERMDRLNRESLANSVRPRANNSPYSASGVMNGVSPIDVGGGRMTANDYLSMTSGGGGGGPPIQTMAEAQALNPPPIQTIAEAQAINPPPIQSIAEAQAINPPPIQTMAQAQAINPPPVQSIEQAQAINPPAPVLDPTELMRNTMGGGGGGGGSTMSTDDYLEMTQPPPVADNRGSSMSANDYLAMTQGGSSPPVDNTGSSMTPDDYLAMTQGGGSSVTNAASVDPLANETYAQRNARIEAQQQAAFVPKTAEEIAARNARNAATAAYTQQQTQQQAQAPAVPTMAQAQAPVTPAGGDTVGTGSVSGWGGGGGGAGGAAGGITPSPPTGTTDMMGGGAAGTPGAMQGGTGQLPGQQQGPGAFDMPGIVDMGDYARYPMIESATQRVIDPYQGFNANPVMNAAATRYNDPFHQTNTQGLQNYAQRTAMQGLGGNQFGQQDIWNQAQGQMGQISPEQQAYMEFAQGGLTAANPYDQRMNAAISGQNVGINAAFDKSRANLENRFGTLNQLGSPAFRSAMKELESGRATQIGQTTADFNMAAAGAEQGMRSRRLADFGGAIGQRNQLGQQRFANLASAGAGRAQGGQAVQDIRSNRLQGLGQAAGLQMQGSQQMEDVARGRLGDLSSAGQFGLQATRDREAGQANRLNQLQSIQGQEYNQVRQRQQDQMGVINNMNAAQAGYDRAYGNAMQQGQTNVDAGLQMGTAALGTLSNPLGSAGVAQQGYGTAGAAGGRAGQAGQQALSSALTNPAVQSAARGVGRAVTGLFNRGSSDPHADYYG